MLRYMAEESWQYPSNYTVAMQLPSEIHILQYIVELVALKLVTEPFVVVNIAVMHVNLLKMAEMRTSRCLAAYHDNSLPGKHLVQLHG